MERDIGAQREGMGESVLAALVRGSEQRLNGAGVGHHEERLVDVADQCLDSARLVVGCDVETLGGAERADVHGRHRVDFGALGRLLGATRGRIWRRRCARRERERRDESDADASESARAHPDPSAPSRVRLSADVGPVVSQRYRR